MTSQQPLVKGATAKIVFPIYDENGDLLSSAAGLDSEYSTDGGSFSDCNGEATEIDSTGWYYLNLTTTETDGDVIAIQVKTSSATGKTSCLTFYTAGQTMDTIDSNVGVIKAKTDNLPASPAPSGEYDGTLTDISDTLDEVHYSLISIDGTVSADGSTTVFETDLGDPDDFWNNMVIVFTSSASNEGQARRITDFVGATGTITVDEALSDIAESGDTFYIIGRVSGSGSSLTGASIADDVWDEALGGHVIASSTGEALSDTLLYSEDVDNMLPSKGYLRGTDDMDGGMDTEDKADVNAECDTAITDADLSPRDEYATEAARIISIYNKMPSKSYLRGTDDMDGGMDTEDKSDINAECVDAITGGNIAPAHEYDTEASRITADVATETKQDATKAVVDAIKVLTDNLPADTEDTLKTLIKYNINKLKLDVSNNKMILYDDDGTSVLKQWDMTDKNGSNIVVNTGVPAIRGKPY